MESYSKWIASGTRLVVDKHHIYVRRFPNPGARTLTFLHGFPTSSWDWAKVVPKLQSRFDLLLLDFLGFGDSDKPRDDAYGLMAQATLVEKIWRAYSIQNSLVVAHDFGDAVLQEILARRALTGAVFLNASIYPELHRPLLIQKLLANPWTGPFATRLITRRTFERNFRSVFATKPSSEEIADFWKSVSNRDGHRIYHKLISYMPERRRHRDRWVASFENERTPKALVWGMGDPISGAPVFEHAKKHVKARFYPLEGVGHYPQTEAPDSVVAAILDFEKSVV